MNNISTAEIRRLDHVVAVKTAGGDVLGFHSKNLEVARLSESIWELMLTNQHTDDEANTQLLEWNESLNQNVKKDLSSKKLNSITINVTQVCNLACTYCAAGGDGTYGDPIKRISVDRTIPQLRTLMDRTAANSNFNVNFLGGEPLLYADGIRILADVARELAATKNNTVSFSIVTNGTRFTDQNISLINSLNASVTVSIDGVAEVNDVRRPGKNGRGVTQEIVRGVSALASLKAKDVTIGLAGVFGPDNLEVERAWTFFRSLPVDWYDFVWDHLSSTAEASASFSIKLGDIANKAYEIGGESELRKIRIFDRYFGRLDEQQQIENFCGAGKTYLAVDARNQISPCHWMIGEEGERLGVGSQIFEDKMNALSSPLIERNNCGDCWARYLCGGGCMYIHRQNTGDKHVVDLNFCERMKSDLVVTFDLYAKCRIDSSQSRKNVLYIGDSIANGDTPWNTQELEGLVE